MYGYNKDRRSNARGQMTTINIGEKYHQQNGKLQPIMMRKLREQIKQ